MKRIILNVEKEKAHFVLELLEQFDFVSVISGHPEEYRGMYDSIISLQKGIGVPREELLD